VSTRRFSILGRVAAIPGDARANLRARCGDHEPWELRTFAGYAEPLYRVLYRSGLVSGYRVDEDEGYGP
jgi:hypothetical protein